ncbi:hypothetical protein [Paenibacillus xylaniclasticus]|nr:MULTISPECIES: hypothetical protein [Paenibacillus]GFN30683.1 hypothetical protein PCURB6_09430 [Paenibacillus curdlanolyticus]
MELHLVQANFLCMIRISINERARAMAQSALSRKGPRQKEAVYFNVPFIV